MNGVFLVFILYRFSGLEKLSSLVSLNLEGNQIDAIPLWLAKKLKGLRNLRLASNNIISVSIINSKKGELNLKIKFLTLTQKNGTQNTYCRLYFQRFEYILISQCVIEQ